MPVAVYDLTPVVLDPPPHEGTSEGPGTYQYWAHGNISDWTTSSGWNENEGFGEPNLRQGPDYASGPVWAKAWGTATLPDLSAIIATVTSMQIRMAFNLSWVSGGLNGPTESTGFDVGWARSDNYLSYPAYSSPTDEAIISSGRYTTRNTLGPGISDTGWTTVDLNPLSNPFSFDATSDLTWQGYIDPYSGPVVGWGAFDIIWTTRLFIGNVGYAEPDYEYSYNMSDGVLQLVVTYGDSTPSTQSEWGIDVVSF